MNHAAAMRDVLGASAEAALDLDGARELLGAMLDGGLPDLELGAWLAALECAELGVDARLGMVQALEARISRPDAPDSIHRTVLLPTFGGAKAALLPVLAARLVRFDIPVLLHGPLSGSSGNLLRALGLIPARRWTDVEKSLRMARIAFAPTGLFSPALAGLLALRERIGMSRVTQQLAGLLDPFPNHSLRVVGMETASDPGFQGLLAALGATALLLGNSGGAACAGTQHRPAMTLYRQGQPERLFPENSEQSVDDDVQPSRSRMEAMLSGRQPLPITLANQLACCLYGAGYCDDFNQAKAIVAMHNLLPERAGNAGAVPVHAPCDMHRRGA
jgi:anthranilate phosphoribosyltransferase